MARRSRVKKFLGIPLSPGITMGPVSLLQPELPLIHRRFLAPKEIRGEIARFRKALAAAQQEMRGLKKKMAQKVGEYEAGVFDAHLLILRDPEMIASVEGKIKGENVNAAFAFSQYMNKLILKFDSLTNQYLRERLSDLRSVTQRALFYLQKGSLPVDKGRDTATVMASKDLPLYLLPGVGRLNTLGFITELGGKTSHFSILARAMELPAISGVPLERLSEGDFVILDGVTGELWVNPSQRVIAAYQKKQREHLKQQQELSGLGKIQPRTRDGHRIYLAANVELMLDLDNVIRYRADGIGLFRSEFLFFISDQPTEEEQLLIYREIADKIRDQPVTIRTFDAGGDKLIPMGHSHREMNPFMGWRSIRVCLDHPDIFKAQMRAILRSNDRGNMNILFPMVTGVSDLLRAKELLREAEAETHTTRKIPVGCMIEVPAAAVQAEELSRHCDFFSIGTNDLIQFTLAVDRGNEKISHLFEPHHPAVLELIHKVFRAAQVRNMPVTVCGEMAGDPLSAVLLLGMGITRLSMSVHKILLMKKWMACFELEEARGIWEEARKCTGGEEINQLLKKQLAPALRAMDMYPSAV